MDQICDGEFGIATLEQKAVGFNSNGFGCRSWFCRLTDLLPQALFNCRKSNLRGEKFRVLVGETLEAGEGCNFLNVRELPPGLKRMRSVVFDKDVSTTSHESMLAFDLRWLVEPW